MQAKLTFSILFSHFRQNIPLIILEEGSYEKDVLFYVNIGEPTMIGGKFYDVLRVVRPTESRNIIFHDYNIILRIYTRMVWTRILII